MKLYDNMACEKDKTSSTKDYGVLQVIAGHKGDVRTVSNYPGGGVLSGSRDLTAKFYQPQDATDTHSEFIESQSFLGPTNFVSTICYGRNKSGGVEIYVGSHDTNIYIYTTEAQTPKQTLTGQHTGPVSTLAFRVCGDEDVLISGSWDNQVVVWRNKEAMARLEGHFNAVWKVAFVARSYILTASADKTIKKWSVHDGQLIDTFHGHTDCVRGLAVINGREFLSCSNDATIIMWSIDGDILKTYEGHTHFIFDICIIREPLKPNIEPPKHRPYKFVSVSEDRTVRIWDKDDGCMQTIPLQATTLWSTAALENSNFVVGTSDGHIYVFSQESN